MTYFVKVYYFMFLDVWVYFKIALKICYSNFSVNRRLADAINFQINIPITIATC